MSDARGQIFFEGTRSLAGAYTLGDDPRLLQLAFAGLFDEAAQAIYRAGADLDEVLVERFFIVRRNDRVESEIRADFLADAELLKKFVLKILAASASSVETGVIDIVGVKIIARQDELPG